jgi:HK97 family phage prohead protease
MSDIEKETPESSDQEKIVYKMAAFTYAKAKSDDEGDESRSFDVIASTEDIDSYGDIVKASWRLERYATNPIVLFGHNSRDPGSVLGTASNVRVEDSQLKATITFVAAEVNPNAERVLQLVKAGVLKGISVGFQPHSYSWEKRNDVTHLVLSDNELFELSVVPIPANPNALTQLRAKAMLAASEQEAPPAAEKATDVSADLVKAVETERARASAAELRATELEKQALLFKAVVEGKITDNQDDPRRSYATKCATVEDLASYLSTLQAKGVSAVRSAQPQPKDGPAEVILTPEEIHVATKHGIPLEEVRQTKAASAAKKHK